MRATGNALAAHLARWGLCRFTSDADYFAWQRTRLSSAELNQLHAHVERKRGGDGRDEVAFYDLTADSRLLPVLYSQRYDYYNEVGPRVASRLGNATRILDVGCGVGILATFYARLFPGKQFVGIDRSPASITVARQTAATQGLANVRFECLDVETEPPSGTYDLIIATHALVQAEQEPGVPSDSWRTFERARDAGRQTAFEQRTGVGIRLDRLGPILVPDGRMIVFEKTRQLARRVPFQRALAARGLSLIEQPEPVRYLLVEEIADDGPFFHLRKGGGSALDWEEGPESDEGLPLDRTKLMRPPADQDAPLYENHWPSAQLVWEQLSGRTTVKETTSREPDGRQMHVELGVAEGLSYLYCANTYDQRQLVIVEPARAEMLESYFQDIVGGSG
jgi:SAM-dependent methyltransferase